MQKDITVGGVSFNPTCWSGLSEEEFMTKANRLNVIPGRKDREQVLKAAHRQLNPEAEAIEEVSGSESEPVKKNGPRKGKKALPQEAKNG